MTRLPDLEEFNIEARLGDEIDDEHSRRYINNLFIKPTNLSQKLDDLSYTNDGRILTNKGQHGYLEVYSKIFNSLDQSEKVNLIELGIGSIDIENPCNMFYYHKNITEQNLEYWPGGSLILWDKFFNGKANIAGWDIDISKARCPCAKLYEVDSTNEWKLRQALSKTLHRRCSTSSVRDTHADQYSHLI